jgi:hypothetical protein
LNKSEFFNIAVACPHWSSWMSNHSCLQGKCPCFLFLENSLQGYYLSSNSISLVKPLLQSVITCALSSITLYLLLCFIFIALITSWRYQIQPIFIELLSTY